MQVDVIGSFGEVLKELRNRKKLSRPKLALRLHMSSSAIEKWERGDVLPDRARVEELIHAMKLSEAERLLLLEAHAGYRILPSVHNLPSDRNPYFTGRTEILEQLHLRLAPGSQVALTQAISGLGGVGKTQVALEYIYRYQKRHSHLFWVTADSRETLTTQFSMLARELDLPEKGEKDQSEVVQAVQRWLREYLDWLLILDNIEDLELVREFVPTGHLGAVLLTTRRQVAEPVAQVLELDVFSEDDGVLFLLKRAKRLELDEALGQVSTSERVIACAIVQQLGGLPLALDQAGAYIAETRCSLSDYLDLFKQRQTALLQRRGTVSGDHPQSVTATFSLAFEQVQQKNGAAIDLLKFCAYLAPDVIALELITQGAIHLGSALEAVIADVLYLDQTLEILQAYSLVQRDGERRTLSIHRLVQAVLKDKLGETEKRVWANRAMLAVNMVFPQAEYGTWLQCEQLLPHALLAAQYIEMDHITSEGAGRLLQETASYLQDRGRFAEAEPLYQRALHIREQVLGPDHPDVATSLDRQAELHREQGKYADTESLFQRAIHIREQTLGPDHPAVAQSLNGLAQLYREQGKYEAAESHFLRALCIREQALGPDHPDVARSLNGLALLYYRQGKDGAEPLFQRALDIWEQRLGPEHPDVAIVLDSLGNLYLQQGKYEEAELIFQRALDIWEQRLGPEHPRVAIVLNNLAGPYLEQGKYEVAEPLYQRALRIREQQLGPVHPDVAYPLNNLALIYKEQGKYEAAESHFLRARDIWEQQLGREHLQVAIALCNLAELYFEQGRYQEVEPLFLQALDIFEQQFEPEHFMVAYPLYGLALLFYKQGKYEEAESLFLRSLRIRERVLGLQHAETAQTIHDLACLREAQGNSGEARVLYVRALEAREQALGAQHPKTMQTRKQLIALLHAQGQHEQATQLEVAQTEQGRSEEERKEHPEE